MTTQERQSVIIDTLCGNRFETVTNLAFMLKVSERTIRRDILSLSCQYPIQTVRGRYGGGIRMADWYQRNRRVLSSKQERLLKRLLKTLDGEDFAIVTSILADFTFG